MNGHNSHRIVTTQPLGGVKVCAFKALSPSQEQIVAMEQAAYDKGYEAASQFYAQQILEHRQESKRVSEDILTKIQAVYEKLIQRIQHELPEMIVAVTQKWIRLQNVDAQFVRSNVEMAMAQTLSTDDTVSVELPQEDYDLLMKESAEWVQANPKLQMMVNKELQPGDCLVKSAFGMVDAREGTKLRTLSAILQ